MIPAHGHHEQPWSFAEIAVIVGWVSFLWTALRWSWALSSCCCGRGRIDAPRKPGRAEEAEIEQDVTTCFRNSNKGKREDLPRDRSPSAKQERRRPNSTTPERRPSTRAGMESPEAKWAQAQILEAMVQRAQPVVQDLRDMHRLGGGGPGPVLRRGSRLQ